MLLTIVTGWIGLLDVPSTTSPVAEFKGADEGLALGELTVVVLDALGGVWGGAPVVAVLTAGPEEDKLVFRITVLVEDEILFAGL